MLGDLRQNIRQIRLSSLINDVAIRRKSGCALLKPSFLNEFAVLFLRAKIPQNKNDRWVNPKLPRQAQKPWHLAGKLPECYFL